MSEAGDNDLNNSTDGSSYSGGPRSISSSDSDVDNRPVVEYGSRPSSRADSPLSMSDDSDAEVNIVNNMSNSTDDSDNDTRTEDNDLSNSTDGSSYSGGTRSISSSDSDVDNRPVVEYGSRPSTRADSRLSMSDDSDAEVNIVNNMSNSTDDSDNDTTESEYMPRPSGYWMDEFVTKKMEDRPPCYDDIENDRIASPDNVEAPIAHSYDQAPNADSSDEPPPVYDASHYVQPSRQSTLTTPMSNRNRVVQPNYLTVTEVTTMTTSEAVIRRDNQENITQSQMIYSDCGFPRRSHSTYTTVYQGPRMTTALNGIVPNHEEIAQRDRHNMLSTVWRMPSMTVPWPRHRYGISYYATNQHPTSHYEFVLQRNRYRPPR
ncbi:dentin sialophosphoprotein-like isoform X2 [Metopolophium dirhodum]|uniref:dentin sialophosphoprotein-like isoform X2 n=1 Tax=Metopolophium dirhodum TaxID=44670 RepID=UPI00298FE715|nr:dentin sialophosphoprotein-like isoform X2 [Metopolophium dirhodum]